MQNKYLNIIGMMSGTSADGIDISFVKTNGAILENLKKNYFYAFNDVVRNKILNIMNEKLVTKIKYKKYFDQLITIEHYKALKNFKSIDNVDLIGIHGQTIHHDSKNKISIQCVNPKLFSNLLRKDIVYNFRQNDLLHGGEGAPIAPIYHKYLLNKLSVPLPACFINLGGISNITYYDKKNLIGFDSGPGNCLIDDYVSFKTGLKYDRDGNFGFHGIPSIKIINFLLENDFFLKKPPKSVDRNFLKMALNKILEEKISLYDMVSTLSNLTVESIHLSFKFLPKYPKNVIVSGGGCNNKYLMYLLNNKLKSKVYKKHEISIDTDFIEAELIAYLTARTFYNLPITFKSTTGTKTDISGGQIFHYKKP